jgi:hypothetical protein
MEEEEGSVGKCQRGWRDRPIYNDSREDGTPRREGGGHDKVIRTYELQQKAATVSLPGSAAPARGVFWL